MMAVGRPQGGKAAAITVKTAKLSTAVDGEAALISVIKCVQY